MQIPIQQFLDHWLPHIKDGTVITTCLSVFGFSVRTMWKASNAISEVKSEWKEVKDAILDSKDLVQSIAQSVKVVGTNNERLTDVVNANSVTLAKVETMVASRNLYRN